MATGEQHPDEPTPDAPAPAADDGRPGSSAAPEGRADEAALTARAGDTLVVQRADGSIHEPNGDGEPTMTLAETMHASRHHEHPGDLEPPQRIALPPVITLLLGIAGGVVAIAGMRQVSSIVAPTFLAVTLLIAVYPLHKALRRVVPSALSALVLVILLYGILASLVAGIALAAAQFATELAKPTYSDTYSDLVDGAIDLLAGFGVTQDQIIDGLNSFDLTSLSGVASSAVDALTGTTSLLLFLLTVIIFLAMDAGGFPRRIDAIHRSRPDVADALVDFGTRVRKYWIVSTIFGIIVAVIDYVALLALGVPLAATFGLLAFITNYIPNVGFVLGLVPPAFIALLDGGLSTMLWVIGIYCVANFVIQSILQPKFTGDAVGINATTAFLSLVFWAFVFGALGALLAIPFTLLVKSLLIDRDPRSRWINQFIASAPDDSSSAQPV
ncbi:AI-2E family transporter [Janibacter alkaliphilus]|uniref:Putative PurR-regulated permease PerM n=1 Tax=Janibacter alkaliphilus TaxID=1069963 RepID=A0A852XG20_9MICO|nr:putative PurR-regulated permease PerM [Janibacter alkaliphilus]